MTIDELVGTIGGYGGLDFVTGDTILETASMVQSINGDGSLTMSWTSDHGGVIMAGTVLGDYIMMDTYAPSFNGDGTYKWAPKFSDMAQVLSRTLFFKTVEMTDGTQDTLYTFNYVGAAGTIIEDLNKYVSSLGTGWSVKSGALASAGTISVSFDGDTVKSAATKIADACGANVYYVGRKICIGMSNAYAADAYYNTFVVLGGTRNMAKKTAKGGYSAITQRLTIDADGSRIGGGNPPMTKLLIFDDVYPKMELVITSARCRLCYLLDEKGEKIKDGLNYKKYAKWYVSLGLKNSEGGIDPYSMNTNVIIQGKPLGILFQSGILTGREFELSYFATETKEKDVDDVDENGFTAVAGEYRIIMQADGDYLLPSLPTDGIAGRGGLCPSVGDKVTLTNVALDQTYIDKAREELRIRGEEVAAIYSSGKVPSYSAERLWPDFMTGESGSHEFGEIITPDEGDSYVVTSITTDLMTGAQTVTYGTFTPKGLISTLVDKVDSVSTSGGGGTTNDEYRGSAPMNIDQFNALQQAGGNRGMVTVYDSIKETNDGLDALDSVFRKVQSQIDKKFEIWFGDYTPRPLADDDGTNYPASEWIAESDKKEHEQDIFYNTERAVGSSGGRVWRWSSVEQDGLARWYWEEVTDADTLAALEKIADISSDGIICGGAEKSTLLLAWKKALAEYEKFESLMASFKDENGNTMDADAYWGEGENCYKTYVEAFWAISTYLNGGDEYEYPDTPSWLSDLYVDTVITPSVEEYRNAWNSYYEAHENLSNALAKLTKEAADEAIEALNEMADDNVLTATEKIAIEREWEKAVAENAELVQLAIDAGFPTAAGVFYNYYLASTCLWCYLDNLSKADNAVTAPLNAFGSPRMLYDCESTAIDGIDFMNVWKNYYKAAEELRSALTTASAKVFVSVGLPTPPYKRGDLWRKLDAEGDTKGRMMICVKGRERGEEASMADWEEFVSIDIVRDPKVAIAALMEKLLEYYDGNCSITLHFQSSPGFTAGDFYIDGAHVYKVTGTGTSEEIEDASLASAFITVHKITKAELIRVFAGERPEAASQYDVYVNPVEFFDSVSGQTLRGGHEVLMWDDGDWVMLCKPTTGVLENLGRIVRMLVFGSDDAGCVDAAGFVTTKNFVRMFAQKTDPDDDDSPTLAEAYLHMGVEYDDVTGEPKSIAKMQASEIEINGSSGVTVNDVLHVGDENVWIGRNGVEAIVLGGDGNAIFTGDIVANDITLKNGINVNDKFVVGKEGILTASDVNISGKITATSGSFKGEVHATSGSFTGEVHATSGSFTGEINATSGVITGDLTVGSDTQKIFIKQEGGMGKIVDSNGNGLYFDSNNNLTLYSSSDINVGSVVFNSNFGTCSLNGSILDMKDITAGNGASFYVRCSLYLDLRMIGLPTYEPSNKGQVWNDNGILKIKT